MITAGASSDDILREYTYHAADGVVQTDLLGRVIQINPVAIQLLMPLASRASDLSNLWDTLESFIPDLRPMLRAAPEGSDNLLTNFRVMLPATSHGQADAVCLSVSMVKIGTDAVMTTISDISEKIRYEKLLGKQEARLNATMATAARHAQVIVSDEGRILTWNTAIQRLTGFSAEQMVGKSCAEFFAPDAITPDWIGDRLIEAQRTGISYAEGHLRRAGGKSFWGQSILIAVEPSLRDSGYTLLLRDTGDHRETIDHLLRAVRSDQLTSVANRRGLHEAAELELSRHAIKPRDIALLLIDIDHFKMINDTFGHPVGDMVLRNLASAMLTSVRDIDVVARLGGEEFAVLLPSTDLNMALYVAERIRARVAEQHLSVCGQAIRYKISIGVAQFVHPMSSLDELIAAADIALYHAKRGGRDRVCIADPHG